MKSLPLLRFLPMGLTLWNLQCTNGGTPPNTAPDPKQPSLNLNQRRPEQSVFLNQLAYHSKEPKTVVTIHPTSGFCRVLNRKGDIQGTYPIQRFPAHPDYPTELGYCDLSTLQEEGLFTLQIGEYTQDLPLRIQNERLDALLIAAQKTYYYQRASSALEPAHAGVWARRSGHADRQLKVRKTEDGRDGKQLDVPGGWYDAGDYGKYVVNAGVTVGTLLLALEDFPRMFASPLNIPGSSPKSPDLLTEIRYELDWFLTMQDEDGGVFFKVGPTAWPGFVLPHEDRGTRYVTGKTTASTLNFAAVCAQASRAFATLDPAYSERLFLAAEKAWQWALQNPAILAPATDPNGGTGGYGDEDMRDEFLWASVELARTHPRYRSEAEQRLLVLSARPKVGEALWWCNLQGLAFLSAARESAWSPKILRHIEVELENYALHILSKAKTNPFLIAYEDQDFLWGSNGGLSNQGMILLHAYQRKGDKRLLQGASDILHYLLGRNIHGISFVTGFGTRSPQHPHHRPSGGDKVTEPVPGFLVGGPNAARNDQATVVYPTPRKGPYCYTDEQASYASNEVAINWNAPFIYLLAGISSSEVSPKTLR